MECLANVPASSQTVKALIVSCCEGSGVTNLAVKKATEYLQQEDQGIEMLNGKDIGFFPPRMTILCCPAKN